MKHLTATTAVTPHYAQYRCTVCGRGFRVLSGSYPAFPDDCSGEAPITPNSNNPPTTPALIASGPVPTVPIRGAPNPYIHHGICVRKPWEYQITVALPCLDHYEETALCVELLRAQTVKPFFVLVDTGSTSEQFRKLEAMRAADLEVHQIALNGYQNSSAAVAFALDLCFSRAETPYIFTTHQDCFVRRKDFLEYLLKEIEGHAVVGWQLTPRFHSDWSQMFGHTAALFDMAAWDAMGATWTIRRADRDGPREREDGEYKFTGNWPDTESSMNMCLLRAKAKTKFLGTEENYKRNKDEWIDHVRSLVCSSLYHQKHNAMATEWMDDAMREARQRLAEWTGTQPPVVRHPQPTYEQIQLRTAECRKCPDERTQQDSTRPHPPVYCARDLQTCGNCIGRAIGVWQSRLAGGGRDAPCEKWPA